MKRYSDVVEMLMPTELILRGLKNASYLTIGHFLSLAISFIGFIYIARLLGPSDYGIYVSVGAFVGLFELITFTGVNKVVLREGAKTLSDMSGYLEKTTGIRNLFTFIAINVCVIGSLFAPYSMQVKLYITLFSFNLIYQSFNSFIATVYKAAEKMQFVAILEIFNRILFVSLSIAFLYMGFGLLSLFLIVLFSNFSTLILNFKISKKFLIFKFWNKIKWDKVILKSALIFSILSFTVILSTKIDLVMISWLRSSKDVGIYGVAFQITQAGEVTRNILATAFFPIFVKSFHKNIIRWKKLLRYAFFMGLGLLAIATIVSLFSEQVITSLFGEKYFESGTILAVLVFYLAISFFSIPFTNALQATYNESKLLKICWIAPSLNIILNYLFLIKFGLIGIAYSTLVVTIVGVTLYALLTWRVLKEQNRII